MRVTEKGQVTIPLPVREALGIVPGTQVDFEIADGYARLTRRNQPELVNERLSSSGGSADEGMSTDDILRLTRGDGRDTEGASNEFGGAGAHSEDG